MPIRTDWLGARRGAAAVATVGALLVGLVPVFTGVAAAAPSASPQLTEGQQALATARTSGARVEVTGQRTEYDTVYANPDGYSFTLESSAVPVRVATGHGGWTRPDATLVRRADGTVGPRAAAVGLSFSGGGDGTGLVTISRDGRALTLGWPRKLPQPTLDGDTAIYPEVLPGVDLRMTAMTEGFKQLLVVKTPKAAANPALKHVDYGLKATGLRLRTDDTGSGLTAVDANGATLFRVPKAQMWDSSGAAAAATRHAAAQRTPALTGATARPAAEPSTAAAPSSGPVPGSAVADMAVRATGSALSVVPDAHLLGATDPTAYPLYIDPTVTWGESERTLLRSDGYEDYAWGNGSDDLGEGVGQCGVWNNYYCGPGYVQRLYFEFSPSSLKGKKVLDATFRVTEPWAFQCDPRWVDLERTGNISSSTTWSGRPANLDLMVDRDVSAGRGSLCDPDSPAAPVEFNDNPDETNENLTSTVASFAAGDFSRLTLALKAHDESDTGAWKRFRNDAVLAVDFVGLPATPTGIGVATSSGTVCDINSTSPQVIGDPTPLLRATPQTVSGGEADAQLRVAFDVDMLNSSGDWVDAPQPATDYRPSTGYVGDNVPVSLDWAALADNTVYRYRAWTRSYYNGGADYLAGSSNGSTTGWCYFKVDTTAPKEPQISGGSPYTECTTNACAPGGGPGVKATFNLLPASGDSNVDYQFKVSGDTSWTTAREVCLLSDDVFVCKVAPQYLRWYADVTPQRSGTYTLSVRGKDAAGRWGQTRTFDFLVKEGDGPVGQWHFDEASGAAVDSSTTDPSYRDDATLSATGATRDARGRRGEVLHDATGAPIAPVTDTGLQLNGSSGYAATAKPVLETRSSYTVSAWVQVDPAVSHTVTVLSQTPNTTSPFSAKFSPFLLSYGSSNKWSLRELSTDGTFHEVTAAQTSPRGAWTHVAGVYDATADTISLYLNGKPQGTVAAGTAWSADGGLQIGRAMYADNYTDYFQGGVDEVRVWQRVLSPQEIGTEARLLDAAGYGQTELVAAFDPGGASGGTLADTSGYGGTLTLTGGASLDGDSLLLDGTNGAATAPRPPLDDTGSFTATTLVTPDVTKLGSVPVGYTAQVMGQRTATGSSWGLWYRKTGSETTLDDDGNEISVPVGYWYFGRVNTDGTITGVQSESAADLGGAVRLTGIFDAQSGTVRFYVGDVQNYADTPYTAQLGSSEFAVGKGYLNGAWGNYLPGRITDVRLWSGAMTGTNQLTEVIGD